jgi:hypothetical protein|uniref:Uncharacterized protein n=1 Tax=Eutreptiella gymnastica TaxID=73025 RepID=A0A7S4FQ51_9EUGL
MGVWGAALPPPVTPFLSFGGGDWQSPDDWYTHNATVTACVFSGRAQTTPFSGQQGMCVAPTRPGGGVPSVVCVQPRDITSPICIQPRDVSSCLASPSKPPPAVARVRPKGAVLWEAFGPQDGVASRLASFVSVVWSCVGMWPVTVTPLAFS